MKASQIRRENKLKENRYYILDVLRELDMINNPEYKSYGLMITKMYELGYYDKYEYILEEIEEEALIELVEFTVELISELVDDDEVDDEAFAQTMVRIEILTNFMTGICVEKVYTELGDSLLQLVGFMDEYKNNQKSNETNHNNHSYNGIHINCPYCNVDLVVQEEGSWDCTFCSKTLIYRGERVYKSEEVCNDSVIFVIILLAKLSKADGVVTQKEISLFSDIISKFKLNHKQMKEVQEIFNREKQNSYDYEKYIYNLYDIFSNDRGVLVEILEEMFKLSHEDGGVHPEQEKIIQKAVQVFRLLSYDYQEIKNKFIQDLDQYYSVLNCNRRNTNLEIKNCYSKLIMRYHPDKFASNDLPEEMLRVAKEKTQDIQESYEKIRKSRNF